MQNLSDSDFRKIVQHTPLVSIDLIIENTYGQILLGRRNNSPARGFWFVPGGRIRKDEDFHEAFKRIVYIETGLTYSLEQASFVGLYQHVYPGDNFAGDPSFGTHYIVVAYRIKLPEDDKVFPREQHSDYWWAPENNLLENPDVHPNARNYFNGYPSLSG